MRFRHPSHRLPLLVVEAEFDGELQPSSEIEQIAFVGYDWKDKSSPVDALIFDDLKAKALIN